MFLLPLSVASGTAVYTLLPSFVSSSEISAVSALVWLLVNVFSSVFLVFIRRLALREKLLLSGLAVTFAAVLIFYQSPGERLDYLSSHMWAVKDIGIAMLCFAILFISERYLLIRPALSAAGIAGLIASLFFGNLLTKLCVCAVFMFVLITIVDTIQRRSIKEGDTDPHKHLVCTAPFILAAFIAVSVTDAPDDPYGWGFVTKAVSAVRSAAAYVNDLLSGIDRGSDAPFIGFSDRGDLAGSISSGGYTVMELTSSVEGEPVLYLAGRVFEDFDGRQWSGKDPSEGEDSADALSDENVMYDTLETLSAFIDGSGDEPLSDTVKPIKLTVTRKGLKDGGTFLPPKAVPGSYDASGIPEEEVIRYYRINTASDIFDELAADGHTVTEDGLLSAAVECGLIEEGSIASFEDDTPAGFKYDIEGLNAYRQDLYERYLPETVISDRLKMQMDETLSGAESDLEKLLRIEGLLRSFTYSDNPGPLPDDISGPADFLDMFMLDRQCGYCSYYATSFVLLARAYGIPARYVQGYRVETGKKLHAKVSSADAHAWPEAYLDGIGWITFEPTPGMEGMLDSSGWMSLSQIKAYSAYGNKTDEPDKQPDGGEDTVSDEDPRIKVDWKRIAIPVVFGLIFTLVLFLLDAIVKRRRYNLLDMREKALWKCRRNMQLLRKKGFGRLPFETLTEYDSRMCGDGNGHYTRFIGIYEKILYREGPVSDDEFAVIEQSFHLIRNIRRKWELFT